MAHENQEMDYDHSGTVSEEEIMKAEMIKEIEIREEKAEAHKKLAWTAMAAILVFTGFMMSPVIPDTRVELLSDISAMFFVAQGTIVTAYFGFTTWMSKK